MFEIWIMFYHRDLPGNLIRCIKIGHKLPGQTIEFCQNSLLQREFLCQRQLESIIKFYIQSTLFTFHRTKFVLYNLHFNETFFSRMFPGITLEGSHIFGESTK